MLIGVGFGSAQVTMDDELIFAEGHDDNHHFHPEIELELKEIIRRSYDWDGLPILADIEELARRDPDHDWRVDPFAPLRGRTYQRHGPGQWVLINSNLGFA